MRHKKLLISILSLSLLTTMGGSVLTPNLGLIQAYFSDVDPLYIRLITSIASLFIMLVGLFFPWLTKKFKGKTLAVVGLILYIVGGCVSGALDNIYLILLSRLILGIGIGIILPLSTGLMSYYYDKDLQNKLMGYSSAINCIGATITSLIAGYLGGINRRLCFLTYAIGIISFVLVLLYLPSENISKNYEKVLIKFNFIQTFRKYYYYIIGAFLVMFCLFIYSQNFSIVATQSQLISHNWITWLSTIMAVIAFFGGLFFGKLAQILKNFIKYLIPLVYVFGFLILAYSGNLIYLITGSAFIGLGKGMGVAFMNAEASKQAGKYATSDVIPLIGSALYLAGLIAPFGLKFAEMFVKTDNIYFPYYFGIFISLIYLVWSFIMPKIQSTNKIIIK